MNRRQRIILSVTGVFLILLVLLGLTYAYFLTRIDGNEEPKSISITTANLELVYEDGNGIIEPTEKLMPGTTLDAKTFTVKNDGNQTTDYVVKIEDVLVTYADTVTINGVTQTEGEKATFESNDFVYTLTCKSYLRNTYGIEGTTPTEEGTCNAVNYETKFPLNEKETIIIGNNIELDKIHEYSLVVTYKDTGKDQSNDMNKKLVAKVNIADINTTNPYNEDTTLLAYKIIKNAMSVTASEKEAGYAELVSTPPTKIAAEVSGEKESVLSATQDDYGTSYYYRGAVKNNYLSFNEMCWRIVRIEGDGSIKLVLADASAACSDETLDKPDSAFIGSGTYGHDDNYRFNYENGQMNERFNMFLNGGSFTKDDGSTVTYTAWSETNLGKLKTERICIGDTKNGYTAEGLLMTEAEKLAAEDLSVNYKKYIRLQLNQMATLVCNLEDNKTNSIQIYPLTADEVAFAGGKASVAQTTHYLLDNAISSEGWWTSTVTQFGNNDYDGAFFVSENGSLTTFTVGTSDVGLRPAVSLVSGTKFSSGDGSINKPYTIH